MNHEVYEEQERVSASRVSSRILGPSIKHIKLTGSGGDEKSSFVSFNVLLEGWPGWTLRSSGPLCGPRPPRLHV